MFTPTRDGELKRLRMSKKNFDDLQNGLNEIESCKKGKIQVKPFELSTEGGPTSKITHRIILSGEDQKGILNKIIKTLDQLFEDIDERSDSTQASSIETLTVEHSSWLKIWLWTLLISLISLILVGGWTRLTYSSLSIVEWKPITGMIPPFNSEGWIVEFEKYKSIPEFKLVNFAITMDEFKFIYWWEWGHRQLARFIGLLWIVGFLIFWIRKQIPERWTFYFFGVVLIGALQAY